MWNLGFVLVASYLVATRVKCRTSGTAVVLHLNWGLGLLSRPTAKRITNAMMPFIQAPLFFLSLGRVLKKLKHDWKQKISI